MASPRPIDLTLSPATRLLWRSPECVHLELGRRAVLVEGLPAVLVGHVTTSGVPTCSPDIARAADDPAATEALVALADQGFLWPRNDAGTDPNSSPPAPRLAGELAALATRHGQRAGAVLAARSHASVSVHGRGRTAAHLAALIAAAGVGRVYCVSSGRVRLFHAVPGGVAPQDEGLDLVAAADAAVRRAAPEVDTTPLPTGEAPDLTVLAVDTPIDEDHRASLHAAGAAHLVLALGADHAVVGPLVLPGLTSCLRCADLHRRDRDPAWPALAAQLGVPRRRGPISDVTVATIAVGVAAAQALTFLDGGDPASVDGTLEVELPDWRLRRRSWPMHPDCDCAGLGE